MAPIHIRPLETDLISLATPSEEYNEKYQFEPHTKATRQSSPPPRSNQAQSFSQISSSKFASHPQQNAPTRSSNRPAYIAPPPFVSLAHNHRHLHNTPCTRPPKGLRIARALRPWIPMILYALTSLVFVVGIAMYRTELFEFLDELSRWLRADEQYGHTVLFFLIFLTTIPPIPLYSTLIILSGYTFGAWVGAIISYFAALFGALVVFVVSRALFRESIGNWLNSYTRIKRVVRAIEKRPKLLFLIRLAPYPYNVLNCLLAASPTLTLHTYTVCTALSLFKVIIHTSIGASIHSFKDFHVDSSEDEGSADSLAHMSTLGGIVLCVAILVYLSIVARRAVDEELDDEPLTAQDAEETESFLSEDVETGLSPTSSRDSPRLSLRATQPMTEVPFSSNRLIAPLSSSYRASFDLNAEPSPSGQRQWS
ncbi:hypothetical protein FA15DRAFT_664214 [Coprinopsis marcescibilis]|uniref:Golgi apparatus membrane protein TVP38 n=1 Tax=Coprinopsis marcescibilis TaxID=230819 RepID=A0A5C3L8D8_COPMA|nr:hypothetical protein FA15DRAFT_664214 [Coprinopsis marcescibilis]